MNQEEQQKQRKDSLPLRALRETSDIWNAWKGKIAVLAIAGTAVGGSTAATANKSPANPVKHGAQIELGEQGHQSASLADGQSANVELANGESVTVTVRAGEATHGQTTDQVTASEGHTEAGQPAVQVDAEHK